MKIDKYVKFLLTIIAACLVLIVGKMYDFVTPVQAETTSSAAILNTQGNVVDVRIVGGVGYDENFDWWNVAVGYDRYR